MAMHYRHDRTNEVGGNGLLMLGLLGRHDVGLIKDVERRRWSGEQRRQCRQCRVSAVAHGRGRRRRIKVRPPPTSMSASGLSPVVKSTATEVHVGVGFVARRQNIANNGLG